MTISKYIAPTISKTAFNCPHCGALAQQYWLSLYAKYTEKSQAPSLWKSSEGGADFSGIKDKTQREKLTRLTKSLSSGKIYLFPDNNYMDVKPVANLHIAKCFNCDEVSVWRHDNLIWPPELGAPLPNIDMPVEISEIYLEAARILPHSGRGAAALVRLCVQNLLKFLGEPGENINTDIASLVRKGLPQSVSQALDVVRVIGNHAVHPGSIDFNDNRGVAESLFSLVNIIVEVMISQPKNINNLFGALPENARKAIEKRDR